MGQYKRIINIPYFRIYKARSAFWRNNRYDLAFREKYVKNLIIKEHLQTRSLKYKFFLFKLAEFQSTIFEFSEPETIESYKKEEDVVQIPQTSSIINAIGFKKLNNSAIDALKDKESLK
jgi:hypothetical protein